MTSQNDDREVDRPSEHLARFDEALRKGDPLPQGESSPSTDRDSGLQDLERCLLRLEHRFPRQSPEITHTPAVTQKFEGHPGTRPGNETQNTPPLDSIGRFQIERELGRGGFGVVLLAYDPELNRKVALKIPRPDTINTPELRHRLLREAKAAAALDHPHIVPIYDVGEHGSLCYITLAYCEGLDLDRWLRARGDAVPFAEAARIVSCLAEAIDHGHQRGILHRDLKPANVMMVAKSESGSGSTDAFSFTPRVTDFGMAKIADAALMQSRSSVFIGTPLYMAPEQIEARSELTPAADVYALGVILYELLTGHPPIQEDSIVRILDRLRSEERPPAPRSARSDIPGDLELICLKCLEKNPKDRYPSAADLAADLQRFLCGEPIQARHLSRWARFGNWARRRRRIRDTGILMISFNAIIAVWSLLNPVLFSQGTMPADFNLQGLWADSFKIAFVHCLCIWLGVQMLKERKVAIWLGTLISAGLFLFAILIVLGFSKPFGGAYENEVSLTVIFNMLCLMLGIQLAACVIAIIAERKLRHLET